MRYGAQTSHERQERLYRFRKENITDSVCARSLNETVRYNFDLTMYIGKIIAKLCENGYKIYNFLGEFPQFLTILLKFIKFRLLLPVLDFRFFTFIDIPGKIFLESF